MKDNFLALKASVVDELDAIGEVVDFAGLGIEGQIANLKQQFASELAFTVLCLGDFSSGKTSFVNKFFLNDSDKLLPVRATPTSAKITTIRYGEKVSLTLKMRSGKEECHYDDISTIAAQCGARAGNRLEEVSTMELRMPSEKLKEGVIIVDSPGLNDPEIERSQITTEYMDHCDCILFFLNAKQSWKRSEKDFIEERVLSKRQFNKIFFLLNFWDLVEDKDREDVQSYTREQIKKSVEIMKGNHQGQEDEVKEPELVPISAKTGENVAHLESVLWSYLADKRGPNLIRLKIEKIYCILNDAQERINESLTVYKKGLAQVEDDIAQLTIEVEKFTEQVETFRADLFTRLTPAWQTYVKGIKQVYATIEENIGQSLQKDLRSIKVLADQGTIETLIANRVKQILHQQKTNIQALERELIETCGSTIKDMKAELNLRQTNLTDFTSSGIKMDGLQGLAIEDHMGTLYIGVGGMVLMALALGSFTGGIGALLTPAILFVSEKFRLDQLRESLDAHLPELIDNIAATLATKYDEIADSRKTIFEKVFENTRNEILQQYREKKELLAKAISDKEKNADQEVLARSEKAKQELTVIKKRLEDLVRNRLDVG